MCVCIVEAFHGPCDPEGPGHSSPVMHFLIVALNALASSPRWYQNVSWLLECQLKEVVFSVSVMYRDDTVESEVRLTFFSITALTERSKSALPAGLIPP